MLNYFLKNIIWDDKLSERAKRIDLYTRVYEGRLYDHLTYFFNDEKESSGYIRLCERQPSVKTGFCKLVVDNSVSLLFGSDHFPSINISNKEKLKGDLDDIVKTYHLNDIMSKAATIGSIGSVVLLVKIIEGNLKIVPKNTKFFTAVFDRRNDTRLVKLIERFPIKGTFLIDQGYYVEDADRKYWFHREWTDQEEIYYIPYLVDEENPIIARDEENTIQHNHGFVPAIWIKNLNRIVDSDECGNVIDGACTFSHGIDTEIEIDYQLSQVGRALKYAADPMLILNLESDPSTLPQGSLNRGASNAMVLTKEDKAHLLELDGSACAAVLDYVRTLREYLLETLKGNRSHADKVSAAQSGKAMQAMNQSLIWLVDNLRVSYGKGYLDLIKMIIAITNQKGYFISVEGKNITKLDDKTKISLSWPDWYPPTPADKVQNVSAAKTATDGGIISKETATRSVEGIFDISDLDEEIKKIKSDQSKILERKPDFKQIENI